MVSPDLNLNTIMLCSIVIEGAVQKPAQEHLGRLPDAGHMFQDVVLRHQIAQALGIRHSAVSDRLRRAREKLRDTLERRDTP